jgi:hypothetical protein
MSSYYAPNKMLTSTVSNIPICYNTAEHDIKFSLTFGEGKEDDESENETERKNFTKNYDVEVFESGEGDEYMKGYRVVANEAPLVIKIGDISITKVNENSKYEYAIGIAVDNAAPEYYSNSSTLPNNIERDGTMWTIPANTGTSHNLDQNPNAKYQWMARRSMEEGYKPTAEELELGMEETSQNTGLVYMTFMVFRKLKAVPEYSTSRGGGGSGTTRGLRGGGDDSGEATRSGSSGSVGARFGYGNEASSSSVKSTYEYSAGTEKYVMPIRLRINNNSAKSITNCSQHLKGASINAVRRQTMTVPF